MSVRTSSSAAVWPEWMARAACRDEDPELFFPAADSGPGFEAQVAAAKAVCARCPVRAECLEFALVALPYGVAGGMTAEERRRERANRAARARRAAQAEHEPAAGAPGSPAHWVLWILGDWSRAHQGPVDSSLIW